MQNVGQSENHKMDKVNVQLDVVKASSQNSSALCPAKSETYSEAPAKYITESLENLLNKSFSKLTEIQTHYDEVQRQLQVALDQLDVAQRRIQSLTDENEEIRGKYKQALHAKSIVERMYKEAQTRIEELTVINLNLSNSKPKIEKITKELRVADERYQRVQTETEEFDREMLACLGAHLEATGNGTLSDPRLEDPEVLRRLISSVLSCIRHVPEAPSDQPPAHNRLQLQDMPSKASIEQDLAAVAAAAKELRVADERYQRVQTETEEFDREMLACLGAHLEATVNKVTDATACVGPEESIDTIKLTLHTEDAFTGDQNSTDLLIDKSRVKVLLEELRPAYMKMEETDKEINDELNALEKKFRTEKFLETLEPAQTSSNLND